MRNRISFCVLSGVAACIFFLISLVHADTFIKSEHHTDSFTMMGQTSPAKDEVITTWIGKGRYRQDGAGGITFIIRKDKKKMYHINHNEKKYAAVDLPVDWNKLMPPKAEQFSAQMRQMFKVTAVVTDTGETKNIRGWRCRKYIVNFQGMMSMKSEIWATKDIKIDYGAYREFSKSVMSMNPMFKDAANEMTKVEGYTVSSAGIMNMMGSDMKTAMDVVEVSEKRAPPGTYDPPAGYEKTYFDPMKQMREGK